MSLAASISVSVSVSDPAFGMPEGAVALPVPLAVADVPVSAVPDFLAMLGLLDAPSDAAPEPTDAALDVPQDESAAAEDDVVPVMPAMAAVPAQLVMALPVPVTQVVPAVGMPGKPEGDLDDGVAVVDAPAEAPRSVSRTGPVKVTAQRHEVPQERAEFAIDAAIQLPSKRAGSESVRAMVGPVAVAARPVNIPTSVRSDAAPIAGLRLEDAHGPAVPVVVPQAAERDFLPAVKLSSATPVQWRQPLAEALGDRLQLNLQRGNDQAVIRLEPPQLGRIDIAIRHEAGSLQVQLSATHGEVVRQLQAIGDSLRQDLGQRAYGEVSVVVSDSAMGRDADGRSRGRPQHPEDAGPGRALAEAESGAVTAFRMGPDTSENR